VADSVVLQASSFGSTGVRVRRWVTSPEVGARAEHVYLETEVGLGPGAASVEAGRA
jgi:hypothetical protein